MAILLYVFVSALNARSTFIPSALSFTYHTFTPLLPHSLDAPRTWFTFFMMLGQAFAFWAIWDWFQGKADSEVRGLHGEGGSKYFPARIRRLLWVLALNGGLLALEAIAQRLDGTGKLLFLVKPRVNPGAEAQFGPWAYRANAAQYFNLLWPVCLGFWWTLHRSAGFTRRGHHWLLGAGLCMAACPIISTSRGGALVCAAQLVLGAALLLLMHLLFGGNRAQSVKSHRWTVAVVMVFFVSALCGGYALGWNALKPRLNEIEAGFDLREKMYETARPMAEHYKWYGTGPGTFESVFQLYRVSTETYWPAQLHNDWLETRITFGRVGLAVLLSSLGIVVLRWWLPGGVHGGRRFVLLVWIGMAGCLAHARFDFPLQIYSIQFLFVLLCALVFTLSRRA